MPSIIIILLALVFTCSVHPVHADIALDKEKKWSLYGDARLRMESDFDGKTAAGTSQNDRTRARIRVRQGIRYQPTNKWTFDTRWRTGANGAHQSPHITIHDFNGNNNGAADLNFDRWYVGYKSNNPDNDYWFWAGRNIFPFWSQDEIFWDEDATLLGAAFGMSFNMPAHSTLGTTFGAFTLPVGMDRFNGHMIGGELSYVRPVNDITYTFISGLFDFYPERDDHKAAVLLNGNGFRKYTIATANIRADWTYKHLPMMAEADFLYNLHDYASNDPDSYTAAHHDQRTGFVLSTQIGDLNKQGHWMAAYFFARVEALSINSTYAQDEWVRWGGGTGENRANNMIGHQINVGYAFTDQLNLLARAYFVESITTREAGNRFRLDLNYRF